MTFTTTELADGRVLVAGTDVNGVDGKQLVDASEWRELSGTTAFDQANKEFDAKIAEFFKPVTDAIAQREDAVKKPAVDELLYIVEQEHQAAVEHKHEIVRKLSHDSVILRAIESGAGDRLIWVNDELVLTAAAAAPAAPATTLEDVTSLVNTSEPTA